MQLLIEAENILFKKEVEQHLFHKNCFYSIELDE